MRRMVFLFFCAFLFPSAVSAGCADGTPLCLFTAIQQNDYASVAENLKKGVSLTAKANKKTVFEFALNNVNRSRNGRIFNLLHKHGMDIRAPLSGGECAMTYAVNVLNDTDLADFLLKRGIDVDSRDAKGRTALMRAVLPGQKERGRIIDYLIGNNADAAVRTGSGDPLFADVWLKRKEPEIALKLLEKTESLPKKTLKNGDFLLLKAIENGDDAILERLTELGASPDDRNSKKQTPLMIAAAKKDPQTVSKLMELGADPFAKDKNGKSALMYLIENGDVSRVAKILSDRPDYNVNERTKSGETPLMFAVRSGKERMVRLFLDRGAKVNLTDDDGRTAFMIALDLGKKSVVDLFLSGREPVDMTDKNGQSALMLFAKGDDLPSFEKMLKNKPDLKRRDAQGRSVLWYAARGDDFKTVLKKVRLLEKYGADLSEKADRHLYVTDIIRSPSAIADAEYWTLLKKVYNGEH